jgi:sugar-specific transcriptional regulator TrmB
MELIEDIETLTELGLTYLQAKIYLTLCRTGQTNIKNLAKNGQVARQEASRATQELLNLGLVAKVISRPTTYEPLPLIDSTKMLLDLRVQKTSILRQKRAQLLKRVKSRPVISCETMEPNFLLIPSGEGGVRQSLKLMSNVKTSYEGVFFFEAAVQIPFEIENFYNKFLLNGGNMRIIICQARKKECLKKFIQRLEKKGTFEARSTEKSLVGPLAVHDRKELFCTTNLKTIPHKSNSFYSNSPILVRLATDYFDQAWNELDDI